MSTAKPQNAPKPLEGLRILAISQYGAGPYATVHLADLGAEIIKIEDRHTGGDVSRGVIPYAEDGDSLYFQSLNRNKKSISLSLRTPGGQDIFRRLVAKSDAVFNNLRGDVPAKLGLTFPQLCEVNPKIVCCSLSGFGTSGSMKSEPAYDYLMQAMLGHMALTGEPDGPPEKYGLSVIDFSTGLMAAMALMAGIHQARVHGVGCDLDVSMFDTAASLLNYLAAWTLNRSYHPEKTRHSSHPSLVPSQLFPTRDGHLVVMCNKEKFFPALCHAIGADNRANDPRFINFTVRLQNKEALIESLMSIFRTRTNSYWMNKLRAAKVPAAPVNTIEQALEEPLMHERGMIAEVDHPKMGKVRMMGTPVKVSGFHPEYRPGPALGEHNEEIYRGLLGLSAKDLIDLRAGGEI